MAAELAIAQVFQPASLPIVIAKMGNGQIEQAVAVQVTSPHVGHSGHLLQDDMLGELHLSVVFQQDNRPDRIVVGKQHTENAHDKIQMAVAVHIDHFRTRRGDQPFADHMLCELAARILADPADPIVLAITDQNVQQAVLIQIDGFDRGDLGRLVERIADRLRLQEIDLLAFGQGGRRQVLQAGAGPAGVRERAAYDVGPRHPGSLRLILKHGRGNSHEGQKNQQDNQQRA